MRGTSKVIMGATLVMLVSLAIVLGLILVLLAELYCSLLLRRRQLRTTTSGAATVTVNSTRATTNASSSPSSLPKDQSSPSPHSSFYAQGVLQAPRSLLFPAISPKEDNAEETKKQHSQLHHVIDFQLQESGTSPRQIGLVLSTSSPPTPLTPIQQVHIQGAGNGSHDKAGAFEKHFVYISNPIYDENAGPSRVDTPFETPDTSPSRLETDGSSGDDKEVPQSSACNPSSPGTPPLTPMKKLPAEACSISLRDARPLGTSGSDSNSKDGLSSSSSGSPCTSPSW
ncbi:uncharacterized protein LOC122308295 [Carya illinoinensis]|uniref:Uncharacterized protein n=1 Tax=Carya illinoinensis TaxID=32201 RepID=A0A8T1QU01_CARIL|nr:uncharacterized protein LOC122308295 [Carya illinoinensis]KAG6658480.1 hypothetical protein CIPAW_04G164600 [Carya illinoinensis]KAG6718672.1 hypothetical protein I3842_04G163500 [Carya illinoinensis]